MCKSRSRGRRPTQLKQASRVERVATKMEMMGSVRITIFFDSTELLVSYCQTTRQLYTCADLAMLVSWTLKLPLVWVLYNLT